MTVTSDLEVARRLADEVLAHRGQRRPWRRVDTVLALFGVARLTAVARVRIAEAFSAVGLVTEPPITEMERGGTIRLSVVSDGARVDARSEVKTPSRRESDQQSGATRERGVARPARSAEVEQRWSGAPGDPASQQEAATTEVVAFEGVDRETARNKYFSLLSELAGGTDGLGVLLEALAPKTGWSEAKLGRIHSRAVRELSEQVMEDTQLTFAEEHLLMSAARVLDVDLARALQGRLFQSNLQPKYRLSVVRDGRPPIVVDPDVPLTAGELCHGEFSASVLRQYAVRRSTGGGSTGLRVGPMSFRGGSTRTSRVVGHEWRAVDHGILTITSTRVIFTGGQTTLNIPHQRLLRCSARRGAIELNIANRQAAVTLAVPDSDYLSTLIRLLGNQAC